MITRPPYTNDVLSTVSGLYSPSTVDNRNNKTFYYWERQLYERLFPVLDFDVPDNWDKDFFTIAIYANGFLGVFDNSNFGVICQPGTVSGFNVFYGPTRFISTNPLITKTEYRIGDIVTQQGTNLDVCELLKLTKDFCGIWDIISYYAEKLAILDGAFDMNLINSKTPYIFGARSKAAAETLKSTFDKVNAGTPIKVIDGAIADEKSLKDMLLIDRSDVKQGYIADLLEELKHEVLRDFDRVIGLPPSFEDVSRERMLVSEIESNNTAAGCLAEEWERTFNESAKNVNERFGLNISCKYRFGRGGVFDGASDTDRTVSV